MSPLPSLISTLIIASIGLPSQAASLKLETERDRMSYSTGHQIGTGFKNQETHLDPDIVKQGIQDALDGTPAQMTEAEMDKARTELRRQVQAARQAKAEKEAEAKRNAGGAFLEQNAKKPGITVLPSGLQYRVIKAGEGNKPSATDQVTVHYRGTLTNGSEFDSSYRRNQPASFPLNGVIAGWTEGLQLMQEGARYEFFIPASLAYGDRGRLAHETLIFEVELISVGSAKAPKAAN